MFRIKDDGPKLLPHLPDESKKTGGAEKKSPCKMEKFPQVIDDTTVFPGGMEKFPQVIDDTAVVPGGMEKFPQIIDDTTVFPGGREKFPQVIGGPPATVWEQIANIGARISQLETKLEILSQRIPRSDRERVQLTKQKDALMEMIREETNCLEQLKSSLFADLTRTDSEPEKKDDLKRYVDDMRYYTCT